MTTAQTYDADAPLGGSIHLADASAMMDTVLAACPAHTRAERDKVALHASDARNALSDGGFANAIAGLSGMARRYNAMAHLAAAQSDKDVFARAASTVQGYADAMVAARAGGARQ